MRIERHEEPVASDDLIAAGAVYAAAFDQHPYAEGPDSADGFYERVARYGSRSGFRLSLCRSAGDVIGLALSVHAYPGDWWRDRCAEALGAERSAQWLEPVIREVVHVAVSPLYQRQGVGRLLTEDSLADPEAASVVLSCSPLDRRKGSICRADSSCSRTTFGLRLTRRASGSWRGDRRRGRSDTAYVLCWRMCSSSRS